MFLFNKTKCNFWKIIELCDWSFEGDDDKVLAPVIDFLSKQEDDFIFCFDDTVYSLLHELYNEKIIEQYKRNSTLVSDDNFLYSRCVALINGKDYFKGIKKGTIKFPTDLEFESLLYVAQKAWSKKHNIDREEYPHIPKYFE